MEPLSIGFLAGGVAALSGVVSWLTGRSFRQPPVFQPPASLPPPRLNLDSALETILVKSLESQGLMFEKLQKLNIENATLAMEAIQRNGYRKAGRRRAGTAARTPKGKFAPDCRLCEDGLLSDPTPAEIIAHSGHRRHRKREIAPVAVEDKGDHFEAHVDERDILTGADGVQQIECPDCGATDHAEHRH